MCLETRVFYCTDFTTFSCTIDSVDEASLKIEGSGIVVLKMIDDEGEPVKLTLKEVTYMPNAFCNLISFNLLGKKGNLSGRWNSDQITIETKDGWIIGRAIAKSGLYHLRTLDVENKKSVTKVAAVIDLTAISGNGIVDRDISVGKASDYY